MKMFVISISAWGRKVLTIFFLTYFEARLNQFYAYQQSLCIYYVYPFNLIQLSNFTEKRAKTGDKAISEWFI